MLHAKLQSLRVTISCAALPERIGNAEHQSVPTGSSSHRQQSPFPPAAVATGTMMRLIVNALCVLHAAAFQAPTTLRPRSHALQATCTPAEAKQVIELAKKAIARDGSVKDALGSLQKVENVLGAGSPAAGSVSVSFAASFRRQGNPFKLMSGETKVANRGKQVCQIKARADKGKLTQCAIQGSGGWGRTLNVKC